MPKIPKRVQFLKQKNMLRVLYALSPVALAGIYFFGWRVLGVLVVAWLFAFVTEWFMVAQRTGKVSYACFVTASLLALSLPPTIPFWMVAVGSVIAILFGKETFGGFGKNVFNPAIVGRAFLYVCFPIEMTGRFVPVFSGFPGGFTKWSFGTLKNLPAGLQQAGTEMADAFTAATPMWARRDFAHDTELLNLVLGNIRGVFTTETGTQILAGGSIGEVSAVVLIISAVYLIYTKTAQWRLMLSTILGAVALNLFARYVLGIDEAPPIPFTLFSGAMLYAAIFMVTDPVSAPKLRSSQWIYGAFIGAMIVFFRYKSIFAGGVGFAILLGNMAAPSLDLWIRRFSASKKKPEGAKAS